MIGIDTAASNGYLFSSGHGEGFAIPVNTAMSIAVQIEGQTDSATVHIGPTAFLGVEFKAAGKQVDDGQGAGALAAAVFVGTPAAQAGVTAGDTIVSLDGRAVDSAAAVSSALGRVIPKTSCRSAGSTHRASTTRARCSSPQVRPPDDRVTVSTAAHAAR